MRDPRDRDRRERRFPPDGRWQRVAALTFLAAALGGCGSGGDGAGQVAGDAAPDAVETAYHRPMFSSDGESVVFMRQDASTGGDWELFLAQADGSGVRRITAHDGWDGYASFAPDGRRIIFDRDEGKGTHRSSVVMDLTTGSSRPLGEFDGWLSVNAWSPNGERLYAFWEKEKDGQRDLYALSAEGEVLGRITDTPSISEHDVQITPDGKSLIFAAETVGGGPSRIDRIDLETGARTTLVESSGRAYGVAISPDGRTLGYTDNPAGGEDDAEIFLLDLATRETRKMTENEDWDHMPVFHPGGAYLLFTSYRSGAERVYRMELTDGSVSAVEFAD